MPEITPETWGWTAISWNIKDGCLAQWFYDLEDAFKFARECEHGRKKYRVDTKKIEIIRVQYKNRMNAS